MAAPEPGAGLAALIGAGLEVLIGMELSEGLAEGDGLEEAAAVAPHARTRAATARRPTDAAETRTAQADRRPSPDVPAIR